MTPSSYLWTSESVAPGHPDKVADQISDAILDAYLSADPLARVACETLVKGSHVTVAGEITSSATITHNELEAIVRKTIAHVGYTDPAFLFSDTTCQIRFQLSAQSREINKAVSADVGTAAGDQGIMFGYATRDTPTAMPLAIHLSRALWQTAYRDLRNGAPLHPDMKSQVSLEYEHNRPARVHAVVFSVCHASSLSVEDLRAYVMDDVLPSVLAAQPESIRALFDARTRYIINPAGAWNMGGPEADCGVTGRKIVVDQYGADCEIGGGAFSGKDPTKVDRSAAYMARFLALRVLREHPKARSAKVQLSYAIGEAEPVSVRIYDPSTGMPYSIDDATLKLLTPDAMIDTLGLRAPIYQPTAHLGHFGIDPWHDGMHQFYAWERERADVSCM